MGISRRRHTRQVCSATRSVLEPLETRRLLSGTVTAAFNSAGVLIIQGDGAPNAIEVHLQRTVGYTITATDGNTTILSSAPGATPVTDGVFIPPLSGPLTPGSVLLGGGDDIVTLSGDFAFHDFAIDTGSGNDQVFANGSQGAGTFSVKTGNGDDAVTLTADAFLTHSNVDTGNGNDVLTLAGYSTFQGTHTYTTGGGNDLVIVDAYDPFIGTHTIDTGAGADRVEIHAGLDTFQGSFTVRLGSGSDTLAIDALDTFFTALTFDGGAAGGDTLTGEDAFNSFQLPAVLNFESVV